MKKLYLSSVLLAGVGITPITSFAKTGDGWEKGGGAQSDSSSTDEAVESEDDRLARFANIDLVRKLLVPRIQKYVYEAVVKHANDSNANLQSTLKNNEEVARKYMLDTLGKVGLANAPDANNRALFAEIWAQGMNQIYQVQGNSHELAVPVKIPKESDILGKGDDAASPQEEQAAPKDSAAATGPKRKTTLLNILMRMGSQVELAEKVQTLIEKGCDKNLHINFEESTDMANQTEYPVRIALFELKVNREDQQSSVKTPEQLKKEKEEDQKLKEKVLAVFFKDKVQYGLNKYLDPESKVKLKNTIVSVDLNKNYILKKLIENQDYTLFSMVLGYIESNVIHIVEVFNDGIQEIKDQIHCPLLETVLEKMMLVRRKAIVNKEKGKPLPTIDYIKEFYTSDELQPFMSENKDKRFNADFQNAVEVSFEDKFDLLKDMINEARNENQIHGEELKGLIKEWAVWANFRNRIASHLNKYALCSSNSGKRSNVVRLVRYTNIYNRVNIKKASDIMTERQEMFRELYEVGGADIIYTTPNDLGWTPPFYAMYHREFEDIQLYLIQSPTEIEAVDGVRNNLLHVAFPQPKDAFEQGGMEDAENKDPLDNISTKIGERGMKANTTNAVIAILSEDLIPKEGKIKALKFKSGPRFTPVSLAAAMGYHEAFKYMKEFLQANNEWNPEDHMILNKSITELFQIGLEKYKASAEKSGNTFSVAEQDELKKVMDSQKQQQEYYDKNAIKDLWDGTGTTNRILKAIKDPAVAVIEKHKKLDASMRTKEPYADALNAAIEAMLAPVADEEEIRREEEALQREAEDAARAERKKKADARRQKIAQKKAEAEKKKKSDGFFKKLGRMFKGKEHAAPEDEEDDDDLLSAPAPVSIPKVRKAPSPLKGMLEAKDKVKISYLKKVVEYVLQCYLSDQTSVDKVKASIAYKAITGTDNQFFASRFNQYVESEVKEEIRKVLALAGKLEEEIPVEVKKDNVFDRAKPDAKNTFNKALTQKPKDVKKKVEEEGWE